MTNAAHAFWSAIYVAAVQAGKSAEAAKALADQARKDWLQL